MALGAGGEEFIIRVEERIEAPGEPAGLQLEFCFEAAADPGRRPEVSPGELDADFFPQVLSAKGD